MIAAVTIGSIAAAALLLLLDARRGSAPDVPVDLPTSASSLIVNARTAISAPVLAPLASTASTATLAPRLAPPRVGPCPDDMVLVQGVHCPFIAHKCDKPRKARAPGEAEVCDRYKNVVLCEGARERLRFCIDRFEYPNRSGVLPAVLVSFDEAERVCSIEEKRLCTVREWSLACEGEALLPYPVGLDRAAGVCQWDAGSEAGVTPSRGASVAARLLAIDRRAPAGAHGACTSPYGVLDLGGNVAEWTEDPVLSKTHDPFGSVIAGGSWGGGPSTCRTRDDAHPPPHRSALVGFRCCAEPSPGGPAAGALPPSRKGGFQPIVPGQPAGLP